MSKQKNNFEMEMQRILSAIQIASPSTFSFAGEAVQVEGPTSQAASAMAQNPPIVMKLQQQLYQHCYCNALGSPVAAQETAAFSPEDFSRKLSQANLSRARWDGNWLVKRVET